MRRDTCKYCNYGRVKEGRNTCGKAVCLERHYTSKEHFMEE